MKWFIVMWILLGCSFYPVTSNLWAEQIKRVEEELFQKKKELERIKKELRLKEKQKEDIQRKESSIRKSLKQTKRDLYIRERVLKQKRARLEQIIRKIRYIEKGISILARDVKQTQDKLGRCLQTLYKVSQVPPEAYFFNMSSSVDLLKMDKYLRTMIEHHSELINRYKHELTLKRGIKAKFEENRIQMYLSISEEGKKKERLRKVVNAEQARLESTANQRATYEKLIREMGKRSRSTHSLLAKLERQRRLLSYGKSIYETIKGKLGLPVQGKIVSLFKERMQNGIEIGALNRAVVRAILPGKVVYADWFKGFGNLIIIDHGDGIFTISGNCSELFKKRGDTVSKGEVIARMGGRESDQECRLYFEMRHRGKPQDPLKWILKPQ